MAHVCGPVSGNLSQVWAQATGRAHDARVRTFAREPGVFLAPASSRPARVVPRRAGCLLAGGGRGRGICGAGPPDDASGWGAGVAHEKAKTTALSIMSMRHAGSTSRQTLPAGPAFSWPQHHPGPRGLPAAGRLLSGGRRAAGVAFAAPGRRMAHPAGERGSPGGRAEEQPDRFLWPRFSCPIVASCGEMTHVFRPIRGNLSGEHGGDGAKSTR